MLDWLWQVLLGVAALAVTWFGAKSLWLERKAQIERDARTEAELDAVVDATGRKDAARVKFDAQNPLPKSRTGDRSDFESHL